MSSQQASTSRNENDPSAAAASLDDSWAVSDHWEEAEEQQQQQEEDADAEDDQVIRQEPSEVQQSPRFEPSSSFLPPQLHPAVSLGMRRVSSCYLSIHSEGNTSVEDLLSLWEDAATTTAAVPTKSYTRAIDKTAAACKDDTAKGEATATAPASRTFSSSTNKDDWDTNNTSCDVLYHDILMHVFTFLDAKDLAAFSETARRPNFECFYFLQLQLQRALLCADISDDSSTSATGSGTGTATTALATKVPAANNMDQDPLSAIAGVASISRLAVLDRPEAVRTVEAFLDSNGTLRTMPLSHSLAYIRQVLRLGRHHGLFHSDQHAHPQNANHPHQQQAALASAALVITVVGAASFMSGGDSASVMSEMASFGTELPNMLFKVGFVGSLMGAAATRTMQHQQHQHSTGAATTTTTANKPEQGLRERAEQMARHMPELFKHVMEQMRASGSNSSAGADGVDGQNRQDNDHTQGFSSLSRMMHNAYDATYGEHHPSSDTTATTTTNNCGQQDSSLEKLTTPNPYAHLPDTSTGVEVNTNTYTTTGTCAKDEQRQHIKDDVGNKEESTCLDSEQDGKEKKMPSGCVGAYSRAVARANARVVDMVKARRKARFLELPELEQQLVASDLIDACCSDESFTVVRDFVQVRGSVDVEGFYAGSDGTETCALHAAAFHGSCRALELLCSGIDESNSTQDGGLCNVNMKDSNGWTAMHFAAGANSVEAVRILAKHGADLSIEAANGYTPLQWAVRLQNDKVAEELRQLVGTERQLGWLSRQPLSAIATRFFALIPSN
jgi:hypothetical protein